ncbi:hypothetical protein ANO11243_024640 [Dothideomycetidae sp. 11243]|nr:hypothetical protein ANO11243_024640 [fungal sp. No.11243]
MSGMREPVREMCGRSAGLMGAEFRMTSGRDKSHTSTAGTITVQKPAQVFDSSGTSPGY